ncbi:MAG: hypothetical protein ABI806_08435 [Candidatus Solibacter sp.]
MRLACICALVGFAIPAFGEGITIVLDFQGPRSEPAIKEMKREFSDIMKESAVRFDFRSRAEVTGDSADLVIVKFSGKCVLEPAGYLYDERGPMAFTYSTDGVVQPFSAVACDKVTSAIRPAMSGGDFAKADMLLGRALGRVLAHEVVHMLSKSGEHGRAGVAKTSLSGSQLIAPELRLGAADLERMHSHIPSIK